MAVAPKMPWGLLLTFAMLAAVVTVVLRLGPGSDHAAPWVAIASVVLAGWAMFLAERWLQNYVWGIVAALVLTLHPYVLGWANDGEILLWPEALGLVVLTANIASWRILFQKQFVPLAWGAIALTLCLGIGLAWSLHIRIGSEPADLRMGLVTGLLTMGGLCLGSILAIKKHRQSSLCWGNISICALLAILCPLVGFVLAVNRQAYFENMSRLGTAPPTWNNYLEFLEATFIPNGDSTCGLSLMVTELEKWGWAAILTLAMMVVGLWRSGRRGWKCWRRGQAPLAWVLTLFAVMDLAGIAWHPPRTASAALLPLAPVAVLLNVFGLADLAQGLGERLVLAPPQER